MRSPVGLLWSSSSVRGLPGATLQAPGAATTAGVVSPSWSPGGQEPCYLPGSTLGPQQSSRGAPSPCQGSGARPMMPGLSLTQGPG